MCVCGQEISEREDQGTRTETGSGLDDYNADLNLFIFLSFLLLIYELLLVSEK